MDGFDKGLQLCNGPLRLVELYQIDVLEFLGNRQHGGVDFPGIPKFLHKKPIDYQAILFTPHDPCNLIPGLDDLFVPSGNGMLDSPLCPC